MNKKQFVCELAKKMKTSKKDMEKFVDSFFDLAKDVLRKGYVLSFRNFGSFKLVQKSERLCYNPQTRGRVLVGQKKTIVYKMSKQLR